MDEESLALLIEKSIAKAKQEHNTREMALTITKLQEARHWLGAHQQVLGEAARKVGQPQV